MTDTLNVYPGGVPIKGKNVRITKIMFNSGFQVENTFVILKQT